MLARAPDAAHLHGIAPEQLEGIAIPVRIRPIPECPTCGSRTMRLVHTKETAFWVCLIYPYCRGRRGVHGDGSPETDEEMEALE